MDECTAEFCNNSSIISKIIWKMWNNMKNYFDIYYLKTILKLVFSSSIIFILL